MDAQHFARIVSDTLDVLQQRVGPDYHLDTEAAQVLLQMIAAHESGGLQYTYQLQGGPARGFFQMELATELDIWDNYLAYRPHLKQAVVPFGTPADDLAGNIPYQVVLARVHLYRVPQALPPAVKPGDVAVYAKKYWNTYAGSATSQDYLTAWERVFGGM